MVSVCAAAPLGAQGDPKSRFVDALGRFSLALDGAFGGERPRILDSLDVLSKSVDEWDQATARYETQIRGNVPADAKLAALMHFDLGTRKAFGPP